MHDVKSTHKVSENRFRVQWSTAPFSPVCLATVGQAWAFHCDSPEPSVSLACWTHHTGRLTNWRRVTVVSVVYQEVVTQCVTPQLPPCPPLYSPVSFSSYLSLPHAGLTAMLHHAHSVYRMTLVRLDSGYRKRATISSRMQWFFFYI